MKRSILFFAICSLALLSGCQKDPWKDMQGGDWNNDHKILNIKFAGQAGNAVVKDVDDATGTVTLQLATNLVADMSAVKLETFEISYDAVSSINRGETVDFTGTAPIITITSATGKARAYTVNMTEFTETLIGNYKITGSILWGGTGPEWGGGELTTPEKKSWCWNTKGYGPTAEYDDYISITLDKITDDGNTTGTCIHYGGVDGKHWNCTFAAKQNKEGTAPVDVHEFYRQIPIGTSTWTRDYNKGTISFTDKDGTVTTGKLLGPGNYVVYNNSDPAKIKSVDVAVAALEYDFDTKDCWTSGIIYSDYDKFVKRPRNYFIFIEPVASIPDASMTEGTEGEAEQEPIVADYTTSVEKTHVGEKVVFTATVSGGTAPYTYKWDFGDGMTGDVESCEITYTTAGTKNISLEVTDSKGRKTDAPKTGEFVVEPEKFDISGNWKMNALWVYGGNKYALGKDNLFTKTWDFDSTLGYEKDNILSFTPSAAGADNGTSLYGAGADGKYWNYLWTGKKGSVNVNEDVSQYYGWMPHTAITYIFNSEDQEFSKDGSVSFKSGAITYKCGLLLPGTFKYSPFSDLVIPANSIALLMVLSTTPSEDRTYEWKDYDKFVNSCLATVTIFTKVE